MTIFNTFDPSTIASGTTMASLGWTDYPGILTTGALQAAPNWMVSSGALTYTPYTGAIQTYPRVLYDVGQPFVRGRMQLRDGDFSNIVLAANDKDFLVVGRSHFGSGGSYTDTISFVAYRGGVAVTPNSGAGFSGTGSISGTTLTITAISGSQGIATDSVITGAGVAPNTIVVAQLSGAQNGVGTYQVSVSQTVASTALQAAAIFPYFLRYNSGTFYNQYQVLPAVVQLEWVVSGGVINIYLDGVLQKVYPGATNIGTVTDLALPSWLVGAQKAGFTTPFGSFHFSTPFQMRDNADITLVDAMASYRYNPARSGIEVDVFCNVAGATGCAVTIADATGATILTGTAPLTGGAGSIRLGPVPAAAEGTLLAIGVSNVGGAVTDTDNVHFPMPLTVPQAPVSIGNNQSATTYYNGFYPLNDLAKILDWRVYGPGVVYNVAPAWVSAPDYNVGSDVLPASYIGRASNNSPTKFPDDPSQTIADSLPWTAPVGEYVMDCTQTPDLQWHFESASGSYSLDLNYYGTLLHRVTVSSDFIDTWKVVLTRDASKTNNGLPTTAWSWSITRAGADPSMPYAREYIDFWRNSAAGHIRYMLDMRCNEELQNIPFDKITGANRVKSTDQTWIYEIANADYPIEAIVALHNQIGKDIWLNIPRPCDDSFVRAYATYIRDHLNPWLKVIWTRSNEVWNFQFPQTLMYRRRGWQQGLGKPGGGALVNASVTNGGTTLIVNSVTSGVAITVGMPVRCTGVPDGAAIAALGTGTGGAGTYTLSSPATATGTDSGAVIGGAVFGANNGAYAFSGGINGDPPGWVSGGSYTVDQLYSDNGSVWRCIANVTGSVAPHNDATHWVLWQDGSMAVRRAHVEHIQAMRASLVDVFGGEAAFRARNQIVCETWGGGFASWLPDYLIWGNNYALIDAVAIAPYFAATTFQYFAASPQLRYAISNQTGAPRIAQFKADATADMRTALSQEAANALALITTLAGMGLPSNAVALWCYESGKNYNWNFSNTTLAANGVDPIDQTALYNDILTFYQDEQYDIYSEFYEGLANIHGGRITHFDTIFPYTQRNFWPGPQNSYLAFGTSASLTDLADTSTMYRALRDVSLNHGGATTPAEPIVRRPQPILFYGGV